MKFLNQATLFLRCTTHSPSHYLLSYSSTQERLRGRASRPFSTSPVCPEDEELNRNVKVSVWWDLRDCSVPDGVNALKVTQNITNAVRANGIKGPVSITAFGDFMQLSRSLQVNLSITGVSLHHIPCGGENTSDRSLLTDLVFWASQNPPPAHLFLISGNKDFANILHRLRMNNYNILLASKDPTPGILCSAASILWPWCQLASGENFTGKLINEPPDGPSESWYSHNRNLLEDSIPDMGSPTCMQAECSPDTAFSKPRVVPLATINQTGKASQSTSVQALVPQHSVRGSKVRAVPLSTKNMIREVLNSYPEGVDSSVLRAELQRRNVLAKDLYGYKKFSLFLQSLGSVLKLKSTASQILVHGIQKKVAEPVGLPEPFEQVHQVNVARPLGQSKDTKLVDSKLRPIAYSEAKSVDKSRNVPQVVHDRENVTIIGVDKKSSVTAYSPGKVDPSPVLPKENVVCAIEGHLGPVERNDLNTDVGVFRRMWRTVFSHKSEASNMENNHLTEAGSISDRFEKEEPEEKSVPDSNGTRKFEVNAKPIQRVGMVRKIVDWCRFWKTSTSPDSTSPDSTSESFGEEETLVNDQSGTNKLFSDVAFWEELLSFLHTNKGASLISQSMTREQMAQQLQKEGPTHLKTLAIADINYLVDLLISEKKWVEESISKIFPFKLVHSGSASSWPSDLHSSNDLSSISLGDSTQSNLQKENVMVEESRVEESSDNSNTNPCGKSKSEILEDCQKLVTEIFKEQPEGFNMSTFKSSFRYRYGYDLDYKRLGYQKLPAMLQTFPGVEIGFDFVLPSKMSSNVVIPYSVENDHTEKSCNPVSQLSNSNWKVNDDDSMWEELGPVLETASTRNCSRPGINGGAKENVVHAGFDDKSDCSEEDLEEEPPIRNGPDGERLTRDSESRKSLLHILDLWHDKGDTYNEDRLANKSEVVDYSRIDLMPSSDIGSTSMPVFQSRGLKKSRKTISFVSDESGDEKGKLVNGILGTLEKSSESRLQR